VTAFLGGGDVGQANQVRGRSRQLARLAAQPGGLLQPFPGHVQAPGGVRGDAQVPQHLGHHDVVAGL